MPKRRTVTDDEHVVSALHAAKEEGAKAILVEISPNTITAVRIFLSDEYRRLLDDEETVKGVFDPKTGRIKILDAPH